MPPSSPFACWNGQHMPLSEVRISALDRGFLFGDAVYEVIRIYRGEPFLLTEHLTRLATNLEKVSIPHDLKRLRQRLAATLAAAKIDNGTIYIQVTRGEGPRAHSFHLATYTSNELLYIKELSGDPYQELRRSGVAATLLEDIRWKRCDIKATTLLANCLALSEAHRKEAAEALLVDSSGHVTEGSHSNLFFVSKGQLITAPTSANILPGITRHQVIQLAEEKGIAVEQVPLAVAEIKNVDECFLTGTTIEVLPITSIDSQRVGLGSPGPVTRTLRDAFAQLRGPI